MMPDDFAGAVFREGFGMSDAPAATDTAEKPVPRPANENPWYLLATLHGEQPKGIERWNFNEELHAKNRQAWNRYMATFARPDVLEAARALKNADGSPRIPPEDLQPLDEDGMADLRKKFRGRGGGEWPEGLINFSKTAFTRAVICNGLWFAQHVNFGDTTFSRGAVFDSATFAGSAEFSSATFSRGAVFGSATFAGDAEFDSATFSGAAWFDNATFSGSANFSSATFSREAGFDSATFSGFANFSSATFSGSAEFSSATFSNVVRFENAKFQSSTSFAGAEFVKSPPKFHGATLHEGTQWHGVEWPKKLPNREEAQQHVYNYERLKQEMERLKKHEDELIFFAREMRAKRIVDGEWSAAGLLNWAYDAFSAYGRSVARPALGFAVTLLLGAVPIALWMGGARPDCFWLHKLKNALWMSTANMLAPLNFRKDFFDADMLAALPFWMKLLSSGQTILGPFFLFLIGLALRNRFRLR
jgi:hypothetical protein